MIEFRNNFSWSFSRHRKFNTCKRQYYYHYYGSWGGWEETADEETRKLFQLKNMTTLPMLAGSLVHDMISAILEGLKNRHEITVRSAEREVIKLFKQAWRQSKNGEWKASPKRKANLFEHYYEESLPEEQLLEIKDTMVESVQGFYLSDAFVFIKTLSPTEWLTKEKLDAFDFDGTKVWVKLDFVARHGGLVYLYDWKTGRQVSEDETQLSVYALYAFSRWGTGVDNLRLLDIYVRKQLPVSVRLNKALVGKAEKVMKESMREMKELLEDVSENRASIDKFPMVEETKVCPRCFFKEICYPEEWREL
ncbi:MAG: PD-(D/E)XK nuclease family protein [Candidatus Neomarinimicrobiota bacterium]